jgi:hypothetical protein
MIQMEKNSKFFESLLKGLSKCSGPRNRLIKKSIKKIWKKYEKCKRSSEF